MKKYLRPSIFWLFIFIPITFLLEKMEVGDSLVFFSSALSIIPIAKLIGEATENLAHYTGDAIGGLLNATFGNFPELIISVVALRAGLHEMVLAAIIGAILANLLMATGLSFFIGGLKYHTQEYNPTTIRMYTSMMFIAVCSMVIPSVFHRFFGAEGLNAQSEINLNVYLAVGLLFAYIFYLFFMIKTHPDLFRSVITDDAQNGSNGQEEKHSVWSLKMAVGVLIAASLGAAFMSEVLVGAAEGTGKELGMTSMFIGIVFVAVIGGAAESISAIAMAAKNKVDLTISIALGSSIQIALFIAPLLVLLSFYVGPMLLNFNKAETGTLFMAVLLMAIIAGDGKSNWYKGIQLITLYFLIALLFYFIPE